MILNWLLGSSERAEKFSAQHPKDPALAALFGGHNYKKAGVVINHDTAMSLSGVWCAVTDISEKLAMLPLNLFEKNGASRNIRSADPRQTLINIRPNRFQNSMEWRQMVFSTFLLRGLSVCEIIENGRGVVTDLIPLHPDYVEPFKTTNGEIAYLDTFGGARRVLLSSEVMVLRGFTFDGVTPVSPIMQNALVLGVGAAADEFSGKYFENGTVVSGVLETDSHLSDAAFDRLKAWTDRHSGVGKSHNPAILEEGLKWKTATVNAADAQLIESKRYSLGDIARIFHFPLYKLSEMTEAKFANVEQQAIDYVGDTLQPRATLFEKALDAALLLPNERTSKFTKINLKGLLRGDSAQRSAFYKDMFFMGVYSPNDILALEDENPLSEHGDIHYVPVNMAPAGTMPEEQDTENNDPDPQRSIKPFVRDIAQRIVKAETRAISKILESGGGEAEIVEFYAKHKSFVERALKPLGEGHALKYYTRTLLEIQSNGASLDTLKAWEESRVESDTNFIMQGLNNGT